MHNVFRLSDQRHPAAAHLSTEIEALDAARDIVSRIRTSLDETTQDKTRLFRELAWVSKAGLLGISVPSEYAGADIANGMLAEVITLVAESAIELSACLKSHFQVIEAIRLFATPGQHSVYFSHALAGEQFTLASPLGADRDEPSAWPHLVADRTGFRLPASTVSITGGVCDWIAVPAIDPKGQHVLALLARDTEELPFRQICPPARTDKRTDVWVDVSDIHVPADNLIALTIGSNGLSMLGSLAHLLNSALDLGRAKAMFADICQRYRQTKGEDVSARTVIGRLAAQIDGASAMVERAGQKLDVAQVSATPDAVLQASLSANAAVVLAKDVAIAAKTTLMEIVRGTDTDSSRTDAEQKQAVSTPLKGDIHQLINFDLGCFHIDGKPPSAWPFG